MALGGVRHGSVSNQICLWEKSVTCGDWLLLLKEIPYCDGLLLESWWSLCRAMTGIGEDLPEKLAGAACYACAASQLYLIQP